jgi:hypothetical protein
MITSCRGRPLTTLSRRDFFSPSKELSKDEIAGIRRLMIAYGIIEETYELYKKWIDKETWDQWDAWLKAICKHPQFAMLHGATSGMFDKDFQEHVSQLIAPSSSEKKNN